MIYFDLKIKEHEYIYKSKSNEFEISYPEISKTKMFFIPLILSITIKRQAKKWACFAKQQPGRARGRARVEFLATLEPLFSPSLYSSI